MTIYSANIILIGDELLCGIRKEANSHIIISNLINFGYKVREVRIIPDNKHKIIESILSMLDCKLLITSGGLGNTHDDVTAECIAEIKKCNLSVHKHITIPSVSRKLQHGFGFITDESIISIAGNHDKISKNIKAGLTEIEAPQGNWQFRVLTFNTCEDSISSLVKEILDSNPKVEIGIYSRGNSSCEVAIYGENQERIKVAISELAEKVRTVGFEPTTL